jgi:DNA-binding transcriptional MerR regulator
MQLLASPEEREQLERLEDAIKQWINVLREQAEALDDEHFKQFWETAQRLALRLDAQLPPSLDPIAANEIRAIMIGGLRKLEEVGDDRPLDILDDFILRAESIRHIVRDALDEDLPVNPDDTKAVAALLVSWLPRATRKSIAELLGVTERTLQRWLENGGPPSRRLFVVAKLVLLLKDAWTPEGVLAWFNRPRVDLKGESPTNVIDDPDFERALLLAAREGRAQHGT